MPKQMECRVTITNHGNGTFSMGMYDPSACRHEPLGTHPVRDKDRIVRGLKERIERERDLVCTFSEVSGER